MKKLFYTPLLTIVSFTLLWSCTETKELMEEIPANATLVAKLNLSQLATNTGCTFDHDKIILPEELSHLFAATNSGSTAELVTSLSPYITYDEVFAFGQNGEEAWFITKTTAKDKVENVLSEKVGQPSKKESFTIYRSDNFGRFYLKDDLIWWQPSLAIDESPAVIRDAVEKFGNIGAIPGTGDFLRKPGAMRFAVNSGNEWLCSDISFNGPQMKAEVIRIDANGTIIKNNQFRKINTDFLNFTPENVFVVAAAGFTPDFDWKSLAPAVGALGGWQANLAFEFVLPILKSIDGTAALAVSRLEDSTFDDPSFEDFQLVLMAAMKESDAIATIDKIRSLLKQYFIPMQSSSPEKLTVNFNGITATMAYDSGFLTIANFHPQSGSKGLEKIFEGKDFAAVANLSSDDLTSLLDRPIPFGVDFDLSADGEKSEITVSLTGVESLFIPTILKVIAND